MRFHCMVYVAILTKLPTCRSGDDLNNILRGYNKEIPPPGKLINHVVNHNELYLVIPKPKSEWLFVNIVCVVIP